MKGISEHFRHVFPCRLFVYGVHRIARYIPFPVHYTPMSKIKHVEPPHGLPNIKALCNSRFVAPIIHNPANIVKSRSILHVKGRGRWGKTSGATGETVRLSCGGMWSYTHFFVHFDYFLHITKSGDCYMAKWYIGREILWERTENGKCTFIYIDATLVRWYALIMENYCFVFKVILCQRC